MTVPRVGEETRCELPAKLARFSQMSFRHRDSRVERNLRERERW